MALQWIHQMILLLVISIFLSAQFTTVCSQRSTSNRCPTSCKQETCLVHFLSCSNLYELPQYLPNGIVKILIINDYPGPKNTSLSEYNFTNYAPPEYKLGKITLQNMSIHDIKPRSFQKLNKLETLDLSYNKLRLIQSNTFEGLNLTTLRLNYNTNIRFHSNAFVGLKVKNLYIENCQLKSLPYEVIRPLSNYLDQLALSNNTLKVLDMKFSRLFERLSDFSLSKNPFDCSRCQNKWLVHSMKDYRRRTMMKNNNRIHATCETPSQLKNRHIYSLSPDDFECPRASVQRIILLLLPNNSAQLTCIASHSQSLVSWMNTGQLLSYATHTNTYTVNQTKKVDSFSCLVKVEGGLNISSTRLQISWPPLQVKEPPIQGKSIPPATTPRHNDSYFFQPQFSLIEMIAGVVGTFLGTLLIFITMLRLLFCRIKVFSSKHQQFNEQIEQCHTNVLYQPTYHGYSPPNNNIDPKFNSLSFNQVNNNHTSYLNTATDKRKRYVSYEPPTYSDNSQTYDIPNHLIAPSPPPPPPPLSSSPPAPPLASTSNSYLIPSSSTNSQSITTTTLPISNMGHFIDFKTQKAV